jgi:hypothetical protein
MSQEKKDTLCVASSVQQTIVQQTSTQGIASAALLHEASYRLLSLPVLAAYCLREIDKYRRGEPYTEGYSLELLHRAITKKDQEAWTWMQHCFGGMVHDWVRRHPQKAVAVVWKVRRTMSHRHLSASGMLLLTTGSWNSDRWLLRFSTCWRVSVEPSWIPCVRINDWRKSLYLIQEQQENQL